MPSVQVLYSFLLANKSISTIEPDLYRKAHDEYFTCRVPEILLYLNLHGTIKQSQIKCLYVSNNMTIVMIAKMLISLST